MSGKIDGVPRELLERIARTCMNTMTQRDWSAVCDLLSAPVVERQEPVAYSYKEYVWATGLADYVWREKIEAERPNTEDCEIKDLVPLYTSPPAPVAVVLPEHRDSDLRSPVYGFARGWNACLDKVKELNQ